MVWLVNQISLWIQSNPVPWSTPSHQIFDERANPPPPQNNKVHSSTHTSPPPPTLPLFLPTPAISASSRTINLWPPKASHFRPAQAKEPRTATPVAHLLRFRFCILSLGFGWSGTFLRLGRFLRASSEVHKQRAPLFTS